MRHLSFLLLILLCGCASRKTSPPPTPAFNTVAELDKYLETSFATSSLPGTSIIVFDTMGVTYKKSMGYADLASRRPFDEHTVMNIASISKTILAVALMKAIDQGKLQLDDHVNKYLPFPVVNPHFPDAPITIRHLATHTSSIRDTKYYAHAYYFHDADRLTKDSLAGIYRNYLKVIKGNERMDESLLLEYVLHPQGKFYSAKNFHKEPPGKQADYSNLGATLAALVIEKATGVKYENYTRQEIFEPLGMSETWWEASAVPAGRFSTRYFSKDLRVPDYSLLTRADGGVITTTSDLMRFMMEMIRGFEGAGSLLSRAGYDTMLAKQFDRGGYDQGIFWELAKDAGGFRHDGSDPGVTTFLSYNATRRRAMVLFTNLEVSKESYPEMNNLWNAAGKFSFPRKADTTR